MTGRDCLYYQRRLDQERDRAAAASCPAVRAVHARLAALYQEKLTLFEEPPDGVRMPLSSRIP